MEDIIENTAEPIPPAADTAPGAAPETTADDKPTASELMTQLETVQKRLLAAEKAITATKSENAKLKDENRKQLSQEEQLTERENAVAALEADLRRRSNFATAKGILADLGISEKEMTEDELSAFVSDNEDETTARCQWLKSFVKARETRAGKLEREKLVKEMPAPPSGAGDSPEIDEFLEAFKKG